MGPAGGHGEARFEQVHLPKENTVQGPGRGSEITQGRQGPGRISHYRRLIGSLERALALTKAHLSGASAGAWIRPRATHLFRYGTLDPNCFPRASLAGEARYSRQAALSLVLCCVCYFAQLEVQRTGFTLLRRPEQKCWARWQERAGFQGPRVTGCRGPVLLPTHL